MPETAHLTLWDEEKAQDNEDKFDNEEEDEDEGEDEDGDGVKTKGRGNSAAHAERSGTRTTDTPPVAGPSKKRRARGQSAAMPSEMAEEGAVKPVGGEHVPMISGKGRAVWAKHFVDLCESFIAVFRKVLNVNLIPLRC